MSSNDTQTLTEKITQLKECLTDPNVTESVRKDSLKELSALLKAEQEDTLKPLPERYVFDMEVGRWRYRNDKGEWDRGVIPSAFKEHVVHHYGPKKFEKFKKASRVIRDARPFWHSREEFVQDSGALFLNTYKPSNIVPEAGDWSMYQELIRNVVGGGEEDAKDLTRLFATIIKKTFAGQPELMGIVVLLYGIGGAGKNLTARLLARCLGEWNCSFVGQTELNGIFSGWLEHKLLVVGDEIFMKHEDPGNMVYRLNPYISEPTVLINDKNDKLRLRPNLAFWMLLSEEERPIIARSSGLRRWWMFEPTQALNKELGKRIAADLDGGGPALRAFMHYAINLPRELEVGRFEERDSAAKAELKAATATPQKKFVQDLREMGLRTVAEHWMRDESTRSLNPAALLHISPKTNAQWLTYPYPLMGVYTSWAKANGIRGTPTANSLYKSIRQAFFPDEPKYRKIIKDAYGTVKTAFEIGPNGIPFDVENVALEVQENEDRHDWLERGEGNVLPFKPGSRSGEGT